MRSQVLEGPGGGGVAEARYMAAEKHKEIEERKKKEVARRTPVLMQFLPGPSKGCPINYPTLPIDFHWAPLGGSWYLFCGSLWPQS